MLQKTKPKIGLLGIMHGLYDKSQPEIPANQSAFVGEVITRLSDVVEIDFPGVATSRELIEQYVRRFNERDYDGIMTVNLLYSPGMRVIQAFQANKLPVLIANIQPLPSVTQDWNWSLLTTNQGIHGSQDTANMLMRLGVHPAIITDDWKSETFKSFVEDWAAAASAARRLRTVKAAVFNKMPGMGDILGDEIGFYKRFGVEITYETIGLVVAEMGQVTEAEIDAQIAEDARNFEIAPDLPRESHRYAARLQLAYEKFLTGRGYEAFTPNFNLYQDDGRRITQLPILGASNLLANGYGYSAEGDVHAMTLTAIGHLLIGNPHFTEMYSLDYARDATMLSHMGEGNWKVARKDRPVRLIDRPLDIGDVDNPPTPVFSAQPGIGTLATLVPVEGSQYRMLLSRGLILDTDEIPGIPMNYTFFKPDSGIRAAMDSWLKYGGTHHQVLFLGDHMRRLEQFCAILGVEHIAV